MVVNQSYYSLNRYLQTMYQDKIYKISLDGGFTCPNRDGTLGDRGCIFCSEGGSGDFSSPRHLSITEQIEVGKTLLSKKSKGKRFIAYFQAFTNTYGPIDYLEKIFKEAINHPDIIGISIATRPDCLNDAILQLLTELNGIKKVWVELGLQTIHETTAQWMRRGYSLPCFEWALQALNKYHIDVVVHLILGLANETKEDVLETIDYVAHQPISGVKLQLLHILKDTDLATHYLNHDIQVLSMDEYIDLLIDCIERLPSNMVIHRLTGDGPKHLLLAPKWSANKKVVLNSITKRFKERETFQGKYYT